jgi:hypothetical protein
MQKEYKTYLMIVVVLIVVIGIIKLCTGEEYYGLPSKVACKKESDCTGCIFSPDITNVKQYKDDYYCVPEGYCKRKFVDTTSNYYQYQWGDCNSIPGKPFKIYRDKSRGLR